MKNRLLKSVMATVMTLGSCVAVQAETIKTVIDDIQYKLNTATKTATVVESWNPTFLEGDIVVPSKITYQDEEFVVTEFDNRAFFGCNEMVNISIPNTVTKLGKMCFRGCSKLTSISLPNSIVEVGEECFRNCTQLGNAILPDNLTEIGQYMFNGCENLKEVHLPYNLTAIPYGCFKYCKRLKELTIPGKVESVGGEAFSYCERLEKVIIPPSVKIWDGTMSPNYGVNLKIYISDFEAFCNIERDMMQNASYWLYLNEEMVTDIVVPEDSNASFRYCASMKSISLPSSVTDCYFDDYAESLEEVNCSSSIKSMNLYAPTIRAINCYAKTPPSLSIGTYFASEITAHVPVGTKELYTETDGWKLLGNIIDDLTGISGIHDTAIDENNALYEYYNLNSVRVDNNDILPGIYVRKWGNKAEKIVIR